LKTASGDGFDVSDKAELHRRWLAVATMAEPLHPLNMFASIAPAAKIPASTTQNKASGSHMSHLTA
jgi:hypothetical protein